MKNNSTRYQNTLKITFATLLITLAIYLINVYGLESLRVKVDEMGALAPLGIFSLRSISIIIPAIPGTAYSIIAGGIFGFKKGFIIICLSDLFACLMSFNLSRYYGRKIVKKIVGHKYINKVEQISEKHLENNTILMTGLLMTGLFDFVCYAVGLTKTPVQRFLPALVISILLSNAPIVALGAGILESGKQILVFALLGILAIGAINSRLRR
tara:strand:- start:707 stop:1342 length:636 start_codon:yes stop_codon:yes gene_type:complete